MVQDLADGQDFFRGRNQNTCDDVVSCLWTSFAVRLLLFPSHNRAHEVDAELTLAIYLLHRVQSVGYDG